MLYIETKQINNENKPETIPESNSEQNQMECHLAWMKYKGNTVKHYLQIGTICFKTFFLNTLIETQLWMSMGREFHIIDSFDFCICICEITCKPIDGWKNFAENLSLGKHILPPHSKQKGPSRYLIWYAFYVPKHTLFTVKI